MKKISITLCILIIASVMLRLCTVSYAEDLSGRVKLTNFCYTDASGNPVNTLTAGEILYATGELRRTNEGEGAQKYVFVTFVYNDNKLVDIIKQEGEVSVTDLLIPTALRNEIILPEVLINTKVKTLLFEDLVEFAPLASPADFGSDSCEILELYANNTLLLPEISSGIYTYRIPLLKTNYPIVFEAVAKNAASIVNINNLSGYTGTADITVVSHSGLKSDSYTVEVKSTGIPDGTGLKYGKKGYVNSGMIAANDFSVKNLFYLSRTTGAFGSCQVGFMEFQLPDVPDDADYSATLELYTYSNKEEHKLKFYLCTDEEWKTKEYGKNEMPAFDEGTPLSDDMAVCPVSSDGTYSKCEIPLKKELLQGRQKVVIAVRPEFGTLNGYAYIDFKTNQPVIKYAVTE